MWNNTQISFEIIYKFCLPYCHLIGFGNNFEFRPNCPKVSNRPKMSNVFAGKLSGDLGLFIIFGWGQNLIFDSQIIPLIFSRSVTHAGSCTAWSMEFDQMELLLIQLPITIFQLFSPKLDRENMSHDPFLWIWKLPWCNKFEMDPTRIVSQIILKN